jgi:ABC-type sugar transport system, periplasmic component
MKKIASWLLVLCLLLSLAPAALADDPVEITIFMGSTRNMNEHTDKVRQWAIDNLGVDMNIIQTSGENFKQQLALYITGGDIPDVIWMEDFNLFRSYAEEGVFMDIGEEIKNYPNLMAYQSPEVAARMMVDGHQYGIASEDTEGMYVTALRKDWLDKLGLTMPTTLDELAEVFRAFTFKDPDGNGENDTYGYSSAFLWPFFGAFGVMPGYHTLNDEGKVLSNSISEEYRQSLAWLRDIYAEKVIDPEIFTMTTEQQYQKWVQGQMGVFTCWWSHPGNAVTRYGFVDLQPEGDVAYLTPPIGPNGKSGEIGLDPIIRSIGISYKATPEKVAAALKLLDSQASSVGWRTFMYGPEGNFFEMDHDKDMTTWTWQLEGKDKEGNVITDMEVYKLMHHPFIQNQSYMLTDSFYNILRRDAFEMATICELVRDMFVGISTPAYQEGYADLEAFTNEMKIKFIMGEASLETDWDAYVEQWLKNGGERVRQSQLEAYNAQNATSYEFAN